MAGFSANVVFIGGYARTGSTLLDRLLGQIEGFASFGELRRVWDRCFRGNQLCGCGRPFRECAFWREVVDLAFGGFDRIDPVKILRNKTSVDNFWNIPGIVSGGWTTGYRRRLAEYQQVLGAFYSAIQQVSGARFLVDSTKDPQHAYILRSIRGFDVRMVHLLRDSRAVAFSWRRVKRRPEIYWRDQNMARFPVMRTALAWDLTNLAADLSRWVGFPYSRVRYEDLVRDPRTELKRIAAELDLGPVDLSFVEPRSAHLSAAHTVAGNPMRFRVGTVELRPDEEWSYRMPGLDRALVTALSYPLLQRYGYHRGRYVSPNREVAARQAARIARIGADGAGVPPETDGSTDLSARNEPEAEA